MLPVGYSVPPGSKTEQLLDQLGRHGHRPAHIHFFVSADGYRKLTTQINIDGDPHLWDDFAFATRDGLIPPVKQAEGAEGKPYGVDGQFALIDFDFSLLRTSRTCRAAKSSARAGVSGLPIRRTDNARSAGCCFMWK